VHVTQGHNFLIQIITTTAFPFHQILGTYMVPVQVTSVAHRLDTSFACQAQLSRYLIV